MKKPNMATMMDFLPASTSRRTSVSRPTENSNKIIPISASSQQPNYLIRLQNAQQAGPQDDAGRQFTNHRRRIKVYRQFGQNTGGQ